MGSAAVGDSKGRLALQLNNTQSEYSRDILVNGVPYDYAFVFCCLLLMLVKPFEFQA
jgi:hypothetical protein